ncbi:hypothetical protein IEO21_06593 [Rhodonia placenta]|uniref:Uncharacterized protein n=1 Tax=Rhodonia placenta TaxID=104341 RepID=A0A8H7U0K5_9APHY|nr:hypothetical protein IEO21_06593 [Postia placenta]
MSFSHWFRNTSAREETRSCSSNSRRIYSALNWLFEGPSSSFLSRRATEGKAEHSRPDAHLDATAEPSSVEGAASTMNQHPEVHAVHGSTSATGVAPASDVAAPVEGCRLTRLLEHSSRQHIAGTSHTSKNASDGIEKRRRSLSARVKLPPPIDTDVAAMSEDHWTLPSYIIVADDDDIVAAQEHCDGGACPAPLAMDGLSWDNPIVIPRTPSATPSQSSSDASHSMRETGQGPATPPPDAQTPEAHVRSVSVSSWASPAAIPAFRPSYRCALLYGGKRDVRR